MDTQSMSAYLVDQIKVLSEQYSSDHMVRELAETYVRLTKHVGCCEATYKSTEYDPHVITAMGTMVWLAQKDIKE
jgi:hypothetical protein